MPFWSKKNTPDFKQVSKKADPTEVSSAMRELMAREPVVGPEAGPWKRRATQKPFPEYRPQRWDRWEFFDSENVGGSFAPEDLVGTVFPDVFVIVDGQWRKVIKVSVDADPVGINPIIFFSKENWIARTEVKKLLSLRITLYVSPCSTQMRNVVPLKGVEYLLDSLVEKMGLETA